MHRLWHIPELLIQIISFLPASDTKRALQTSHHFRTTLKAILPPHLRPFPDHPSCKSPRTHDYHLLQDLHEKARALRTRDTTLPDQFKMTDAYFHWREVAHHELLGALKPSLHPVLGNYATRLLDGYGALAEGRMNVRLQVSIPYARLYDLVHGEQQVDGSEGLTVKAPVAVTVFCTRVLCFDSSYANVRVRDCGAGKALSVRVENEGRVRVSDVLDELRGTLVVGHKNDDLEQDVGLLWVLQDE